MHPHGRTASRGRSVPAGVRTLHDVTPSAVLFDYAGVLTEDMWDSVGAFCARHGIAPERIAGNYRPGGDFYALSCELECGRVEIPDFEPRLAELLGLDDHTDLVQRLLGGMPVESRMVATMQELRAAGVRIVLLSNSWGEAMYDPSVRALCDAEVLSGVVGTRKPDPEIYGLAVEAAGVPAHECVFVDDQPVNLPPAEALGITTIHHTDPADTIAKLQQLFLA